ncbi:MAG: small multi-drug export protein [bacterium]
MLEDISHINPYLAVMVAGMLPVLEHGTMPLALAYHLPLLPALAASLVGNFISVSLLLWLLGPLTTWVRSWHPTIDNWFERFFAKTHRKHSTDFDRWGSLFLMIIVSIPLPFIGGTWTGTLLAHLFGIRYWRAVLFVLIGSAIATTAVALVSLGGISAFRAII